MRSRWCIAVAWLGVACSDSHGARVADDMSASGGGAGSASGERPMTAAQSGDRDVDRDPPSMVGTGTTPPADAPPDPDHVDRTRDPSALPPASGDDPAQPPRDPDLPSSDIGPALYGHWFADGQVGDCIAFRDWYSFEPGGALINRAIDHNACSGVRLVSESSGGYAISSRELEITLVGPGSERPFDMAEPLVDVASRFERFTYAIAERPAAVSLPSETFLDAKAFHSLDGKRYDSSRFIHFLDATGTALFMQQVDISLHMSHALPVSVGRVVDVVVHAELSQFDQASGMVAMTDTIELRYLADVRDEAGWRVVEANAGLSAEESNAAWQAKLDDAGIGGHPAWAQRLFQAHFFPSQRHRPYDVTLLSSTLPEYGRWTKSPDAPPVPVNAP